MSMTRIAVIGAGHWGPNLIRNFNDNLRSEVAWVVDTDPRRLEMVRARYPGISVSEDANEALSDASVDAAVIATPTITHYDLVKAALERDKHVMVEKPITADSRQGAELVELARRRRRVVLTGHVFLFNSGIRYVKQYLAEGELGRVYYISMVRTNLGPIRMDVNAAWDLAAHDISIVDYWLDAKPLTVSAVGRDWINRGNEDAIFATLHYPNDVLVNLHASWLNPRKVRDVTVVGERRMLTFDDMNGMEPIRIYDKQVTDAHTRPGFIDSLTSFRAQIRDGDITIPKVSMAAPLTTECNEFLDCIQEGSATASDGAFGLAVVKTLEAVQRSIDANGREEEVES